jgi:hypothetical protein
VHKRTGDFLAIMASIDYDVGFMNPPEGFKAFLEEIGYKRDEQQLHPDTIHYIHAEHDYPWLYYTPQYRRDPKDQDEIPWLENGHRIIAKLNIYSKDLDQWELPEQTAKALVKRFDAVMYDYNLEEFFKKEEI